MQTATEDTRPLLSWALIARNEGRNGNLERCLKSLRERTPNAQIVVVDTCSSDDTVEVAKKYADIVDVYRGPRGDWTPEMAAFDDAAAARNHSFSLATGKWVGYVDADDTIPPGEVAEKLLVANNRRKPASQNVIKAPERMTLEDLLRMLDDDEKTQCIMAEYAYRFSDIDAAEAGKNYACEDWQTLPRIVRNNGQHVWMREGHEFLVHKTDPFGGRTLTQLVVMHHKRWDAEDLRYSIDRHRRILKDRWLAGKADLRDIEYLTLWNHPDDAACKNEFYERAYMLAERPLDRYFILTNKARDCADNGFWLDAEEHFMAAYNHCPELPDAPFMAGDCYSRDELWGDAAKWYLRGTSMHWVVGATRTNPRDHAITYPARAATALTKIGDHLLVFHGAEKAKPLYEQATEILNRVRQHTAIGVDKFEAETAWAATENKRRVCDQVLAIRDLWEFLLKNDETEKALKLLEAVPYGGADCKEIVDIELCAQKYRRHMTDASAYLAFYDGEQRIEATEEKKLDEGGFQLRIGFAASELARTEAKSVLELGPFDGQVTREILGKCPGIESYVCLEPDRRALGLLERNVTDPRVSIVKGYADPKMGYLHVDNGSLNLRRFDAIIVYELIEHVQDPEKFLAGLTSYLAPGGRIFISTPLGPYDRGTFTLPRDPRGHVRAMSVRDLHDSAGAAGLRAETVVPRSENYGASLFGTFSMETRRKRPVTFLAQLPHWGWNASKLRKTGMGASEECLGYLAEHLAQERRTETFTLLPANQEPLAETILGHSWWPLEQTRYIDPESILVVSRTPAYGLTFPNKRKILWLQDTRYDELTPKVAEGYEKIVCVSEWHKRFTVEYSGIDPDKIAVIPNFLLRSEFSLEGRPARNPAGFIYASSPDRGLIPLLRMWPMVKDRIPEAELHIFYGWRGIRKLVHDNQGPWVRRNLDVRSQYNDLVHQDGVYDHGMVPQAILADAMMRSSVHAAPWDFQETDGNTFRKMRAAGVINVCPPLAGIPESAASKETFFVEPTDEVDFLRAVFDAVMVPEARRLAMAAEAIEGGCLEARLPLWNALFDG